MRRRRSFLLLLLAMVAAWVVAPAPGLGALWRVYGPSMEPTIASGSMVIVDQIQPKLGGYRRGDIVILSPPGWKGGFPFDTMIKRVIALPGEHVTVADGRVHVDGRLLDEPYVPAFNANARATPPIDIVVPPGEVFVMGDHRGMSIDSTTFGAVPVTVLHGRVLLIVGGGGIAVPQASPLPGTVAAS